MNFLRNILVAGSVFGLAATASAEQLTVADCAGKARATLDVKADSKHVVSFDLIGWDPTKSKNPEVALTNKNSGTSATCALTGTSVSCLDVGAGSWSACPSNTQLSIDNVTIQESTKRGALSEETRTVALLGGGIGTVAALAIGGSQGGSDGDSASLINSDDTPLVGSSVEEASDSVDSAAATARRPRNQAEECLNDDEATVLSPFS